MNIAEFYHLKRFEIYVTYISYMLYVALNIVVFPLDNKVYFISTFYGYLSYSVLFDTIFGKSKCFYFRI